MKFAEDFKWKSKRLIIGLSIMLIVSYLSDKFIIKRPLFSSDTGRFIGFVLLFLGFLIASIGGRHLKIYGRSNPNLPRGATDKLVTQGIYRYVRHPMFTAFFVILVGIGLTLNSITFTFVMAPLGIAYILWFAYNVDEREAYEKFGDKYKNYRDQVPAFFPIPGKKYRGK